MSGRVLRIIGRLNIGGPARHAIILADRLRAHGFETRVVHGQREPGEASLEDYADGRAIETLPLATLRRRVRPWSDLRALVSIYQLARADRPAVIHTHTSKAGAVGRLAAWCYKRTAAGTQPCLVVHTFHGHVFEGYFSRPVTAVVCLLERLLARLSDRIVAISESQRRDLVEVYRIAPASKVVVVPLGLELDELYTMPARDMALRRALGFRDDDFVFGYVGRLAAIKDLPTVFGALRDVVRHHPAAHLAVVGDGKRRDDWQAMVRSMGLDGRVKFAGWQRGLPALYGSLDAVVMSSISEGTPVALIEGMAAGRPVIGTRVGGIPDVIDDGRTGLIVPARDTRAMAAAMTRLLDMSPDERLTMGELGRADVRRRFSAERLADDMASLYESSTVATATSVARVTGMR